MPRRKINPRNRKKRDRSNEVNIPETFCKVIKTFLPKIGKWVSQVKDPRNPNQIDYDLEVILWTALFVGILRLRAMRNINTMIGSKAQSPEYFLENFKSLFGMLKISQHDLEAMPDYETVTDVLNRLDIRDIEGIQIEILKRLIRHKVFEKHRLLNEYYMIAIDGSRILKFKERHCDKCLTRKIGETENGAAIYEYYHYVLDAKLITYTGLCIPVLTEFIENEEINPTKQDCELKGFYRLAEKLKKSFPRLKIVLLFDSLYAAEPVMKMCTDYHWKYLIRYKEGSIPSVYKEYQDLLSISPENRGFHSPKDKIKQEFRWVNDITYESHLLHIIEMDETKPKINGELITTPFCYISSFRINENNYKEIINRGGRCRWKIENQGFQTLKNKKGYNAGHAYILKPNGINSFYLFLQIAFTINQLIQNSSFIKEAIKLMGSIENFVLEFYISFTRSYFYNDKLRLALKGAYQIRLDSS